MGNFECISTGKILLAAMMTILIPPKCHWDGTPRMHHDDTCQGSPLPGIMVPHIYADS